MKFRNFLKLLAFHFNTVYSVYIPGTDCLICYEPLTQQIQPNPFNCTHTDIHSACINTWIQHSQDHASCPICREAPTPQTQHEITSQSCTSNEFVYQHYTFKALTAIESDNLQEFTRIYRRCLFSYLSKVLFLNYAARFSKWGFIHSFLTRITTLNFQNIGYTYDILIRFKKYDLVLLVLEKSVGEFLIKSRRHVDCLVRRNWKCSDAFFMWYKGLDFQVDLSELLSVSALMPIPFHHFKMLFTNENGNLGSESLSISLEWLSGRRLWTKLEICFDYVLVNSIVLRESSLQSMLGDVLVSGSDTLFEMVLEYKFIRKEDFEYARISLGAALVTRDPTMVKRIGPRVNLMTAYKFDRLHNR